MKLSRKKAKEIISQCNNQTLEAFAFFVECSEVLSSEQPSYPYAGAHHLEDNGIKTLDNLAREIRELKEKKWA